MKERSLVIFTLLMQASVGTSLGLFFFEPGETSYRQTPDEFIHIGWLVGFLLAFSGLTSSFFHLKLPLHAWRGIRNVRTSWLSREILFASIFTASMFVISLLLFFHLSKGLVSSVKWIALISGLSMIFCMGSAYRLNTTKFWNSPQTIVSFYTSALLFGLLICGVLGFTFGGNDYNIPYIVIRFVLILAIFILLKLYFSYMGFLRLTSGNTKSFVKIRKFLIVHVSFGFLAVAQTLLLLFVNQPAISWLIWMVFASTVISELFGRVLFYEAQVPYGVYLLKI